MGGSRVCSYQPHPTVQVTSSNASLSQCEQRSQPHEGVTGTYQVAEVLPHCEAPHLLARFKRQAAHDIAIVTACRQHKPLKGVTAAQRTRV